MQNWLSTITHSGTQGSFQLSGTQASGDSGKLMLARIKELARGSGLVGMKVIECLQELTLLGMGSALRVNKDLSIKQTNRGRS